MTSYRVDGIGCEGCATATRKSNGETAPAAEVAADIDGGLVTVDGPVQDAAAREAIARAGYSAIETLPAEP